MRVFCHTEDGRASGDGDNDKTDKARTTTKTTETGNQTEHKDDRDDDRDDSEDEDEDDNEDKEKGGGPHSYGLQPQGAGHSGLTGLTQSAPVPPSRSVRSADCFISQ